jgi:excisionase family DNA binding protein
MVEQRLLTLAQAAVYLGMTERALRPAVQRRRVPFVRPNPRSIRFDIRKLDEWIEEISTEALDPEVQRRWGR